MLLEKKRNKGSTCCELFSHFIILALLVMGYYIAKARHHEEAIYSKVDIAIPSNKSTLQTVMDIMQGPLWVPSLDQYAALGKELGKSIGSNRKKVQHNPYGKSLSNMIDLGTMHFAPAGAAVDSLIAFMNRTSVTFRTLPITIYSSEHEATHVLKDRNNVLALIVVDRADSEQVSYKIRQRYGTSPNTNQITNTPSTGFNTDYWMYMFSGFMTFKQAVDQWAFAYTDATNSASCANGPPAVTLTPFPTFAYDINPFYPAVGFLLGLAMIMSTLYPMSKLAKAVVEEKELKMRELMKIMGLTDSAHQLSWLVLSFVLFLWIAVTSAMVSALSFLRASDFSIVFLYFLLFCMSEISLAFLVSVFFSNSKLAAIAAPVVIFVTILPRYVFYSSSTSEQAVSKLWACLLSPTAFAFGADFLASYESAGIGIQYGNLFEGQFSFGHCLVMMAADALLYGLLAWYLDQVLLREHGTPRHWLFICSGRYWCPGWFSDSQEQVDFEDMQEFPDHRHGHQQSDKIEQLPISLLDKAAVRIKHLSKTYADGKQALRDLSLCMLEGHITCLLGHNGAGKSTTISALTGMTEATRGNVSIFGYLLSQHLPAIRQMTGLCPQGNVLFPCLTVREHLIFFGQLKGLHGDSLDDHVKALVEQVGLVDKTHVRAAGLSGGMKRKLCLAMALVGNPKFILLDEPTSGMDPYSRRATWEMLQKAKVGRVILLTTHFMDEADTLADRIAILSEGCLLCSGSSLFLKNRYGSGYMLTVTKSSAEAPVEPIEAEVKSVVQSARLLSSVAAEVVYALPPPSAAYSTLFHALDSKKHLGIKSIGLSMTSLEQVFLSIAHRRDTGGQERSWLNRQQAGDWVGSCLHSPKEVELVSITPSAAKPAHAEAADSVPIVQVSAWQQIGELYKKRLLIASRDLKGLFFQILFPALQILLIMFILNISIHPKQQSIVLNGDIFRRYDNVQVSAFVANPVMSAINEEVQGEYQRISLQSNSSGNEDGWNSSALSAMLLDKHNFQENRYGAVVFNDHIPAHVKVDWDWVTSRAIKKSYGTGSHSDHIPVDTLNTTALLAQLTAIPPSPPPTGQGEYNFSLLAPYSVMHNTTSPHAMAAWHAEVTEAAFKTCTSPSSVYRTMNHPLPATHGTSIQDTVTLSVIAAVFILIPLSQVPAAFVSFLVKERVTKCKHLQIASGVEPCIYWLAAYLWDMTLFAVLAALVITAFYIVGQGAAAVFVGTPQANLAVLCLLLAYGCSAIPLNYLYSLLFRNPSSAQISLILVNFLTGFVLVLAFYVMNVLPATKALANVVVHAFRLSPGYCIGEALINMTACYLQSHLNDSSCGAMEWFVTGRNILIMVILGAAYGSLVCLTESSRIKAIAAAIDQRRVRAHPPPPRQTTDEDVQHEEEIVRHYVTAHSAAQQMEEGGSLALLISGLIKTFLKQGQPRHALRGLSLACRVGERFGLLGVNGAGKTTTLGVLTGEIAPSSGKVYIANQPLARALHLSNMIGYCPQVDPLLDLMTGLETLLFFGRIRGLAKDLLEHRVHALISQTGLLPYAARLVGTYSGGNKRKLSLAVALIGDPKVLLLDEPSTGMDPEARRQMWNVIQQVSSQRTVVLVSHSMEEIEALCTRVAVMVSGRMQCLGSVQHLKTKFGAAYTVELRCRADNQPACLQLLGDALPGAQLEEQHGGFLRMTVQREHINLSAIFALLEASKEELQIYDYSVSQCSLEQVFVKFAKDHEEEEEKGSEQQEEAAVEGEDSQVEV